MNSARGSKWRKWDLQVQTILDDNYISISEYLDELKSKFPEKIEKLSVLFGGVEVIKKYDSKEYFFTDTQDNEKTRADNYAKLFINFLDIFNEDEVVVAITDHNYYHKYLIDSIFRVSENTKVYILPGVEINVQGVHILVLFSDIPYKKSTYSEGIMTFLTKIGIDSPRNDNVLSVCNKSYTDVINEIKTINALFIYPHCNSSNGLFQERGKTDRTHLADQFNFSEYNILQASSKSSAIATENYIKSNSKFTKKSFFTLGTDARALKNILQADSEGNFCWIKADPTFRGLQHVTLEPEGRVYIGETPEVLTRVENNKTKYIKSLKIKKKDTYKNQNGVWFEDAEIQFNHELIAIIGNKGSGKSAVADILGLMGDTRNAGSKNENFTFLNSDKFLKRGYGENFKATLEWEYGDPNEKFLHEAIEPSATETMKYIPQNYFEALCNHDEDKFEEELRSVVFKHLKPEDRLGADTFSELLQLKTKTINSQIQDIKGKISILNTEIIALEEKKDPQYLIELQNKLKVKEEELEAQNKIEPKKVDDPSKDTSLSEQQKGFLENLNRLNQEVEELGVKITEKESQSSKLKIEMSEIETLITELDDLEASIKNFRDENKQRFNKYGFDVDKEITITVNKKTLSTALETKAIAFNALSLEIISEKEIEDLEGLSDEDLAEIRKNSLTIAIETKKIEIGEINKKLDAPLKIYKKYLDEYRAWKEKKDKIVGNKEAIGTLEYLKEQIRYVNEDLESELLTKRDARITHTLDIFDKKSEIKAIYDKTKKPIDDLITTKQNLLKDEEKEYQITVDTSFKLENFVEDFLNYIDKGEKGSFRGVIEGANVLNEIIKEKNLNNKDDIKLILETILKHLEEDQRTEVKKDDKVRVINKQIAGDKVTEFYNYLFGLGYLKENYELRLDGKILNELSPGEKGSLLLVFYLMLDKDDIPLIIDQPEDNLDNQSVSKILVPFIKEARKRRQIIMVTHNPNLAVVADAEQVIHVSIDKKDQHKVAITTGAIENPIMNKLIVDVLEGTMPAFDNRKLKYITSKL